MTFIPAWLAPNFIANQTIRRFFICLSCALNRSLTKYWHSIVFISWCRRMINHIGLFAFHRYNPKGTIHMYSYTPTIHNTHAFKDARVLFLLCWPSVYCFFFPLCHWQIGSGWKADAMWFDNVVKQKKIHFFLLPFTLMVRKLS